MRIPQRVQNAFHRRVDAYFAAQPQPVPDPLRLQACKIVSHRGEHDNRTIFENTPAAFDRARDHGVWGIEFDLRWTRDLHPVVFHDPDGRRLFGSPLAIGDMTLAEVEATFPLIPTLEAVVARCGRSLHLMIELKTMPFQDIAKQRAILQATLRALRPQQDYHFLALDPERFAPVDFVPSAALLPVAELNLRRLSRQAIRFRYGGITGHYLLMTAVRIRRHRRRGQRVGTGFVNSKNCLFRELNRGVEWVFTNNAAALEKARSG
ncbi:MAG: glycerophosphodiester phosphodiesterase [Desulfobacterales bacterium]|nr:glycerophosphodiester phosphodiesterase [Desulfobacterales bacterium]